MLKVIGIIAVSWGLLSALFVAFVWPRVIDRINASVPAPAAPEKDHRPR